MDVPFVGRVDELAGLDRVLTDALGGRPRLVLRSASAGLGKSTLLSELASHARHEGVRVLLGTCHEDLGIPYLPVATALGINAGGLFDLEPTGRAVVVLGTTIVTEGEGTLLLQRFVDWHDVMLQAGITAFPRPIVELRAAYGEADVRAIDGMSEVLDKVDELRAGHFD